ncbi:MAG: MmcB family DNA repair protein [Afipia sp.]|nr:MmcB family DNA repair protein [Afipia sp.]
MHSPFRHIEPSLPPDRRQSDTALAIARGTSRFLKSLGFSCVSELTLPSGRRADLVAMNARGDIWIVEIKSSVEDLRADQKWQDYRMHCDRLFFAFTQEMPCELFPADTGLIVADAYGAHLHCDAPEHRLPAATRKSMIVSFGLLAAQRISRLIDPQGHANIDEG